MEHFFEIKNYAKISERLRFIHKFSKKYVKHVFDIFINQNVLGPLLHKLISKHFLCNNGLCHRMSVQES